MFCKYIYFFPGCDILLEFLEVAIHNVLFIRNVYPAAIFVRRKKYGVPVQMSVHPYVNEYITECLKAVRELLKKNEVKKVTLTFSDRNKIPLERFVFDILDLNRNFQIASNNGHSREKTSVQVNNGSQSAALKLIINNYGSCSNSSSDSEMREDSSVDDPGEINYPKEDSSVICDTKMRIRGIVARWPGSTHDSRIFRNSTIRDRLERGEVTGHLLGDSGYPCMKYLLTPILNPRNAAERRYNRAHVLGRNVVERTFGIWKKRFPCIAFGLRTKIQKLSKLLLRLLYYTTWQWNEVKLTFKKIFPLMMSQLILPGMIWREICGVN
ncbi:hypothetical protein C0J52_06715 [Blattella germanica]|nr:hypothetical protein C0J52_06715 [Blattella germanica]